MQPPCGRENMSAVRTASDLNLHRRSRYWFQTHWARTPARGSVRVVTLEVSEEHIATLVDSGFLAAEQAHDRSVIAGADLAALARACPPPPPEGAVRLRIELPAGYIAEMARLGWLGGPWSGARPCGFAPPHPGV